MISRSKTFKISRHQDPISLLLPIVSLLGHLRVRIALMLAPSAARTMATTKTTWKPPNGASMSHSATAGNKIVPLACTPL